MQQFNTAARGLVTPLSARFDPFQAVATQSWNIVCLPNFTVDVHSGSGVAVYDDADPAQFPSPLLHEKIRAAWGLDDPDDRFGLLAFEADPVSDCFRP